MAPRVGPPYGYHQVFIESFFGRFASLEVAYPAGVYALIQVRVRSLGLVGLVVAARRALARGPRPLGGAGGAGGDRGAR